MKLTGIKARMMKELKNNGVRFGEKNGAIVKVEHLKLHQIVNLWNKVFG